MLDHNRRVYEETKSKENKLKQKFADGTVLDICFGGKNFFRKQYTDKYYVVADYKAMRELARTPIGCRSGETENLHIVILLEIKKKIVEMNVYSIIYWKVHLNFVN